MVVIDGFRFEIEVRDPRRWSRKAGRRGGEGVQNIAAPMPGKVVRVLVAPGDAVETGQGLVVVEAMKMQNEMKAARAGRVLAVPARKAPPWRQAMCSPLSNRARTRRPATLNGRCPA